MVSWFSRRPREVVVTHRIERLDEILAALRPPAPPEPPPEPAAPPTPEYETVFVAWLDEQGYPETRRAHYRAAFDVVIGRRPVPQGFTRKDLREELKAEGAPLP